MIWDDRVGTALLSQGDVFDDCRAFVWENTEQGREPAERLLRVIVLTQACDLAQAKAAQITVAVIHDAQELVRLGVLKSSFVRDQIRTHRVYGWYFLPACPGLSESLVDLRNLHTVPRDLLEELIADGKRVARLLTPYREHMAQHFATTYARIALPEPYDTEP